MKILKGYLAIFWFISQAQSQNLLPPENPFLIDSPFPAVHNGSYRQGNTLMPGLEKNDEIRVSYIKTPRNKVSPWLLYSEKYPDGNHTIWGSTSTHIFKVLSNRNEFRVVSSYRIDYNPLINDLSWSFLMLDGHRVLTYDDNKLYLFTEEDITDPYSKIILSKKLELPNMITTISKLCRLYDGNIAFASDKGMIGVLNGKDFTVLATYQVPLDQKEIAYHNDYAVDENGNFYISTSKKMLSIQWNGKTILPKWEVGMDFGGNRFQRVGTTPTLLGSGNNDKLVCIVDSHEPARLITFWRDNIPMDWEGLQGYDRRVADVSILPGSKQPNFMNAVVENSPTAYGYEIACAQYNGLLGQSCNTVKGVYKWKWDTSKKAMQLMWHRNNINLNNVLVYSISSNALYGSGRETDCNYYYYTLDWDTGSTVRRDLLGNSTWFDDPGNANVIGVDRSIIFNSKKGLVRIMPE